MMIIVCWQGWRETRQEFAVDMNKGCHDVGLRKQLLEYHNSWDCWYFILLVWFWVSHCVDVHSAQSCVDIMSASGSDDLTTAFLASLSDQPDRSSVLQTWSDEFRVAEELECFSEKDQVEFLTKLWKVRGRFSESEGKEEEVERRKLEIYAKELIKKLSISISDKIRKFIGIPLLTRMLVQAFDKEVKTFCQSADSMPDLPFNLDLCGLYGKFIERKYDVYQEKNFKLA
jgi:hypothetical protein